MFEGNEPNKQPSSKLRRELSIQYNANGEIIILGRIDLFEKVDVKQWYASGKISPMKKSKLKTIWGFGDIIELEIVLDFSCRILPKPSLNSLEHLLKAASNIP